MTGGFAFKGLTFDLIPCPLARIRDSAYSNDLDRYFLRK